MENTKFWYALSGNHDMCGLTVKYCGATWNPVFALVMGRDSRVMIFLYLNGICFSLLMRTVA